MKHKEKRVLMFLDDKFHYWPAETVPRREFQGWQKATSAQAQKAGYSIHADDEPATKTSEKGA